MVKIHIFRQYSTIFKISPRVNPCLVRINDENLSKSLFAYILLSRDEKNQIQCLSSESFSVKILNLRYHLYETQE